MGEKHLVILVHGIRDIARWQTEVANSLRKEGFTVEHTNYDRMNLIEFLLPIPYFRNKAIDTVWSQMQHAMHILHPDAKSVSVIAHSFGTFIVASILQRQFVLKLKKIIFCGSVVRYNFPFEQVNERFQAPILNDVGTADPWPAVAESVTTAYGSAGTFGFNRPGVRDRFHNDAGHGYFFKNNFCQSNWIGFLKGEEPTPGDSPAKNPPFWVVLLKIFKIKYVFAALGISLALLFIATFLWGPKNYSYDLDQSGSGFSYWNDGVGRLLRHVGEPCWTPKFLCNTGLGRMIAGRSFKGVAYSDGNLRRVVSCKRFRYPGDREFTTDPNEALAALEREFPMCVQVKHVQGGASVDITLRPEGLVSIVKANGTNWLMCGCEPSRIETIRRSN